MKVRVKALHSVAIDLPDGRLLNVGAGQVLEIEAAMLQGSWGLFQRLDVPDDNKISKAVKVDENEIITATIKPIVKTVKREKAVKRKPRNAAKR